MVNEYYVNAETKERLEHVEAPSVTRSGYNPYSFKDNRHYTGMCVVVVALMHAVRQVGGYEWAGESTGRAT